MISRDAVLLLSVILFCLGLIGLLSQKKVIKTILSIEIMIFASIINFCYFAGAKAIKSGHFAAFMAVVLSGLTISVVYTLITKKSSDIPNNIFVKEDYEEKDLKNV